MPGWRRISRRSGLIAAPDGRAGAGGRIELRAGDAQVPVGAQLGGGVAGQATAGLSAQQAHVATAVEADLIEAAPIHCHRRAGQQRHRAARAEADAVADIDQVRVGGEAAHAGPRGRTVAPRHRRRDAVAPGARRAGQP
ncbi:hypothetical protein WJ968_04440 [Achromobacter xylosoxidans]